MNKTLILAPIIATIIISTALYGEKVVSREPADKNKIQVIYWEKWTGSEGDVMRKVVDAFNKSQNNIFVKYLAISGVDQKTLLATAGGNPPDIAGIWQEQAFQFADAGALLDLSGMAKSAGLTREYYIPAYYDSISQNGKLWALPSTPSSVALHVRPDLIPTEFATPETFPRTFEGLDKLSDKISKLNKDGSLKFAGFLPSSPGWWTWGWGNFFGGNVFTNGKPTLDTPEALRAFTWATSYARKYGVQAVQNFQSGFGTFSSPEDPFIDGKVAAELNGVWKSNFINIYKKGLPWFAVPVPYPADRPDLAGHTVISQDIIVIPKGAKHPKEAFEFMKFMQQQEIMEMLCTGQGKNSPLNKVSDSFFKNHPNKAIRLFDTMARSPLAFYPARSGFNPQLTSEIGNAYQEMNTGVKTPKQALHDAQIRIDSLWATYQKQVLTP
jgi:multiple sugar transport system substrate-binding protein